jgi:hypothetical protein
LKLYGLIDGYGKTEKLKKLFEIKILLHQKKEKIWRNMWLIVYDSSDMIAPLWGIN